MKKNVVVKNDRIFMACLGIEKKWRRKKEENLMISISFFGERDCQIKMEANEKTIYQLLSTLEVKEWERLCGTFIRLIIENGKIIAIGHSIKDVFVDANGQIKHLSDFETAS